MACCWVFGLWLDVSFIRDALTRRIPWKEFFAAAIAASVMRCGMEASRQRRAEIRGQEIRRAEERHNLPPGSLPPGKTVRG